MTIKRIESSYNHVGENEYWLGRDDSDGRRWLFATGSSHNLQGADHDGLFPLSPENAQVLRTIFPWLRPQALGLSLSAGCGDRLGLATPGHILAVCETGFAPIFAQQSCRENLRTHRTPQQVMDDALWGVFQLGWREPWGADGDHLKTPADIKSFWDAGFTFFTVDPGEHVCAVAQGLSDADLYATLTDFDFSDFGVSVEDCCTSYTEKPLPVAEIACTKADVLTALRKYGKAIQHVQKMYNALVEMTNGVAFDFEVSVDETDWPTSPYEHFFIASELKRLGVHWTSLAPRFVGRFEKGVDYIGDLGVFETEYRKHAAVQKYFGFYKISLHSGSDKFSIYKITADESERKVHLKTAGTSYLEALRVIAMVEPLLFREIYAFSRTQYDTDKLSYHVSAEFDKMPDPQNLTDAQLPDLLEDFHARQALHVCFGTVLDRHSQEILAALQKHYDLYDRTVEKHFKRHFVDFQS